jgi:hypothetical protein
MKLADEFMVTIAQLNKRAELTIDYKKGIKLYVRSADLLFKQVISSK